MHKMVVLFPLFGFGLWIGLVMFARLFGELFQRFCLVRR